MRTIEKQQRQLGETDISKVTFDPKSRDDIPQLLRGLQHIYCNPEIREEVFEILETAIPEKVDRNNSRPGMELWKIFVSGTLRLNLNCDYEVVVKAGHTLVKKKEEEKLGGRCDSFVVKTNVHYPTDINLLYDAARKVIQLIAPYARYSV